MIDQSTLKSIEDLHRLKIDGIITEEEFERSKERLLFGGKPAAAATASAPRSGVAAAIGMIGSGAPDQLPAVEDHVGWVTLPLRRYADFQGRSTRREFWMFQLVYLALFAVIVVAFIIPDSDGDFRVLVLAAVALALLALLVPLLAVQARRFHDQDRSALLVLVNFLPYVGVPIVFAMMLVEGTAGDNRFGPDPRRG